MNIKKTLFSSFFLIISLITFSQSTSDTLQVNLSGIEIYAQRNKLYSEMGRVVTVIGKAEISKLAVHSIDELLESVSGIDIRNRGVNGTQADISIRGGSFDQVLVLLNGVNITDPQTGHFNLDIPLNLSDVSRVEILQGSSARVLGPNAFSGAINIVTDNGNRNVLNAELAAGSYDYFSQSVAGSFGNKRLRNFASVNHKSSKGFISNTDFDMSNVFLHSVLSTPNAGKFDFQLAAQLKDFGANGFYSLKFPNQRENTKTFLSSVNWALNKGNFAYSAQAFWRRHHDRFELDHAKPAGYNYHQTDVTGGKISASALSSLGKSTFHFDLRNEHVFSNALGVARDSIPVPFETKGAFTKEYNRLVSTALFDHSVNINKWNLSVGLASTYSADFKFSTYGGIDVGYAINDNIRMYASANSATRLPTFTDLFLVTSAQKGNPDLKPEQSKTIELGTKINQKQWKLNAAVYYRMGQNVIDWIKPNSTSAKYEASNLAEVNALGTEMATEYNFTQSFINKIGLTYSYIQLDKSAEGFDSKYALDYLKHKLTLQFDHKIWHNISVSWKAGYYDRSGTYDSNTVLGSPAVIKNYMPYFMLNGRLLWTSNRIDVYADCNNILNATYSDYGGLTQPGINFNAGVRLKL